MRQGNRIRRKWPYVLVGVAVLVVVGAVLLVSRLLSGSGATDSSTVIAYATATVGKVSTTVSGSGSLADATTDVSVPVGVVISDIYVRAGDTVAAGDVLAAVEADSVDEAIDLVNDEIETLSDAASELGGSASIERAKSAYEQVLSELNELDASGYIRADISGTIDSVNVQKGGTVTTSTGASSSSDSSTNSGSGSGAGYTPASFTPVSLNSSPVAATTFAGLTTAAYLLAANAGNDGNDALGEGKNGEGDSEEAGDENKGDYQISAKPYVTATVSQAQTACAATANVTKEEATQIWLINLCEAKAWQESQPESSVSLSVELGNFALEKGVYTIVFSPLDDPTEKTTSYVILENDTAVPLSAGSGGDAVDSGSNANSSFDTSGIIDSGGSGSSGSDTTSDVEETVIDNATSAAFQILSSSQAEVQIQLDELDVAAVREGQQATVELSALEGQSFAGTVSSVTTSSGSYYAVISIEKAAGMYTGFSATATIIKEQVSDVVTIPLAAVQQQGDEVFVYTAASEDGTLGGQTTIETGLSNEDSVEVLSGLAVGTTVYYQQFLTSSAASTGTNSSGFGGTMSMPGGASEFSFSAPSGGMGGGAGGRPSFDQQ